ncbi:MAG: hypothetical protein FJ109_20385, partial [Deltaproteobacteria bacterium]|nr:hypothetical protein [Deltaproteobacteria bacterium]
MRWASGFGPGRSRPKRSCGRWAGFGERRVMIVGILLAAGASQRMGRDKLSLPWRGSTVLTTTLAGWAVVT